MYRSLGIPEDRKDLFAQPLGHLISGKRNVTIPKVIEYFKKISSKINIFTVGDIVTQDFIKNEFLLNLIKLSIIDGKTKREKIKINFEGIFENVIEFKNPAGMIHKDSWLLIKQTINSKKKTLIKIVEGEEDLLVIPLIIELSFEKKIKNFIVYGQPPITDSKIKIEEGIVLVEVTKKIKKKISDILETMKILN